MRFTLTLLLLNSCIRASSMARPTTRSSAKRFASASVAAAVANPSKKKTPRVEKQKATTQDSQVLFTLDDSESVLATLLQRPSKRNRSPYVADISIPSQNGREAICHVPSLELGGKCVPGVTLLCKPARDKQGSLVGPDAVSPKYGTPKCEYIAQLVHVDETSISKEYIPTWVGAHPSLGEQIANELISRGNLFENLVEVKREVSRVADLDMRADFVLTHEDGTRRVVEVKTVLDTDYSTHYGLPYRTKCVFTSDKLPYTRTAIFPWGQSKQKGPDGEKVVSARAIKHVRELTKLASTIEGYQATVLFIVIRNDAESFRPNFEACPSFCKYLKQAKDAGVEILAKRVSWNLTDNVAQCLEDKQLEVEWPQELDTK